MKKLTLQFTSLAEMVLFSKALPGGFLMNTITLTIKITAAPGVLDPVLCQHNVACIEVNDVVSAAA